jgi:hypothetical protein
LSLIRGEDPGVDERIIVKWVFEKLDWVVWTATIWFRRGTSGELLRMR